MAGQTVENVVGREVNQPGVHLPAGQVTWHVPDAELPWFRHLKMAGSHWDGHTTDEKYQRLNALPWDGTPGTRCLAERWEFVEHAYLGGRAWEVTFRCDRKHGHVGAHSYEGVEFEAIPALPKPWTTCDATAT